MRHQSPPRPRKLHVGHLTRNISREVLHEVFSIWGNVTSIELPVDRSNGVTRGFAYVEYATATEAEQAVQCMNGGKLIVQKTNTYFLLFSKILVHNLIATSFKNSLRNLILGFHL